jgi:hypothetical protein
MSNDSAPDTDAPVAVDVGKTMSALSVTDGTSGLTLLAFGLY